MPIHAWDRLSMIRTSYFSAAAASIASTYLSGAKLSSSSTSNANTSLYFDALPRSLSITAMRPPGTRPFATRSAP